MEYGVPLKKFQSKLGESDLGAFGSGLDCHDGGRKIRHFLSPL
jgi:hypothetical protein